MRSSVTWEEVRGGQTGAKCSFTLRGDWGGCSRHGPLGGGTEEDPGHAGRTLSLSWSWASDGSTRSQRPRMCRHQPDPKSRFNDSNKLKLFLAAFKGVLEWMTIQISPDVLCHGLYLMEGVLHFSFRQETTVKGWRFGRRYSTLLATWKLKCSHSKPGGFKNVLCLKDQLFKTRLVRIHFLILTVKGAPGWIHKVSACFCISHLL